MSELEELYDYDVLRRVDEPTMFVVRLEKPTLVLGSSQSTDLLNPDKIPDFEVRRRRGGGGIVLLQPDDIWIDWWIPASDSRWSPDVHVSSINVGVWWKEALEAQLSKAVSIHEGPLEGEQEHRVICFAGKGPGELFIDGKKTVGVTQWRVREGTFLSSVIHAKDSSEVVSVLKDIPPGLAASVEHQTTRSIGLDDSEVLINDLAKISGPWLVRQLFLRA